MRELIRILKQSAADTAHLNGTHIAVALPDMIRIIDALELVYPNVAPELLDTLVEKTLMAPRLVNCLRRKGIKNVGDILKYSKHQLLTVPGFGKMCIYQLEWFLNKHNLKLNE